MRKLTALLAAVLMAAAVSACDLDVWFPASSPAPTLPIGSEPPGKMPSPTIEIPPPI